MASSHDSALAATVATWRMVSSTVSRPVRHQGPQRVHDLELVGQQPFGGRTAEPIDHRRGGMQDVRVGLADAGP